jgi:hypothetical protein
MPRGTRTTKDLQAEAIEASVKEAHKHKAGDGHGAHHGYHERHDMTMTSGLESHQWDETVHMYVSYPLPLQSDRR